MSIFYKDCATLVLRIVVNEIVWLSPHYAIANAGYVLSAHHPEQIEPIREAITFDYIASGVQGKLPWMTRGLTVQTRTQKAKHGQSRQERHQGG